MYLDLRLKIDTRRDKSSSMTDWIDNSNDQYMEEQRRQLHFDQVFGPMASRTWQAFVARINHDADKLNKNSLPRIKDKMRINGRDLIPSGDTLNVDNIAFPAIYLDVRLDTGARSIHIHQLYRESLEGKGKQTDERLLLELDVNDQIIIKDSTGKQLTVEEASRYVLGRFLDR